MYYMILRLWAFHWTKSGYSVIKLDYSYSTFPIIDLDNFCLI